MTVDIKKIKAGDKVTMDGNTGIVQDVDHEETVIWVDFNPNDPNIDGLIDLDPDEPDLELADADSD